MSQAVKRGVGRPRASNKTPRLPAREDILVASAELFAEFGFKGTSTKKIAEKVGIRQPSLFHHFRKKQDILTALVEDGGTPVLNYLREIDFAASPAVELYKLLVFDYHFLLSEPLRIGKILSLPEVRGGPLKTKVEANSERVMTCYRRLIAAGAEAGTFEVEDLDVTTATVFGMGEATWSWYRPSSDGEPRTVAVQIADLALRALLKRRSELARIKKAVDVASLTTNI